MQGQNPTPKTLRRARAAQMTAVCLQPSAAAKITVRRSLVAGAGKKKERRFPFSTQRLLLFFQLNLRPKTDPRRTPRPPASQAPASAARRCVLGAVRNYPARFRGRAPKCSGCRRAWRFLHTCFGGGNHEEQHQWVLCPSTPRTGGGTPPRRRGARRRTEPLARRSPAT